MVANIHVFYDFPFGFVAAFFITLQGYFKIVEICLHYIVDPILNGSKMTRI